MNDRFQLSKWWPAFRKSIALILMAFALLAPVSGFAQEEDEKPKPAKEWVVGYALLTLPMAAAMYFMFRMNKRRDFKLKKEEGDE